MFQDPLKLIQLIRRQWRCCHWTSCAVIDTKTTLARNIFRVRTAVLLHPLTSNRSFSPPPLFFIPMGILTAANNSKSIIYQQSPIIVIHCYWVSEADSSPFYPRNFSVCFLPSGKAAQPFFRFLIFEPFSSDDVWISSQINLIFSSEWRSRSRFYLCGFHHDSRNGSRSRWDANVFDWKGLASALILRWWLTHYFLM